MRCGRHQRQALHLECGDDLLRQVGERSLKGKLLEQTGNVLMDPDSWILLEIKLDKERGEQTQEHRCIQSATCPTVLVM